MMTANERIVKALKTISEHRPDISLTGLISRQSSVDDIRFMSDEDLALVLEDVARVKKIELLNQVQAVDMFHELFQKAKISKIEDHL